MIIQPIVEGQGDVAAVPLLLRRLRDEAQAWGLEVGRPHRKRRTQLVKKDSLQSAVRSRRCAIIARRSSSCSTQTTIVRRSWPRPSKNGRGKQQAESPALS